MALFSGDIGSILPVFRVFWEKGGPFHRKRISFLGSIAANPCRIKEKKTVLFSEKEYPFLFDGLIAFCIIPIVMTQNTTQTMTAKFVKDVSDDFNGTAKIFEVNPPIPWDFDYDKDTYTKKSKYVVASAVNGMFGTETYLFPCYKNGKVKNWLELSGSAKGIYDCEQAIQNAGYEIQP